jgi:hypothetical protein
LQLAASELAAEAGIFGGIVACTMAASFACQLTPTRIGKRAN